MKRNKPRQRPPAWINKLLTRVCRMEILEGILGDLEELFQERVMKQGVKKARFYYCFDAIGFIRPFALRQRKSNSSLDMFIHHLRLALRNLGRRKTLSTFWLV